MHYKVKFFDYPAQFKERSSQYLKIITEVLSRGSYIMGQDLQRFEVNLAKFAKAKYAIGVANCTDALLLALWAAGIKSGDEVICVSHTFVATIEVIRLIGAKPVLIDIADDHNMDINLIESAITKKTKAILPVHLNGRVCAGMDTLLKTAKAHNLAVVEDAAQSLGASYKNKKAGTFGSAGAFSFYPAKLLGAFGDAGAVITNSKQMADAIRLLRDHGRDAQGKVRRWGLNCRLDNMQAAILDAKLKKVPEWISRRRAIASQYHLGLQGIKEIALPPPPAKDGEFFDVFQNYEIEAQGRDALKHFLAQKGIGTILPWAGKGVHQLKHLKLKPFKLPRTEKLFRKALMLPMYAQLKDTQAAYVIECIRKFYNK